MSGRLSQPSGSFRPSRADGHGYLYLRLDVFVKDPCIAKEKA